jgi:dTDP-4-dehydrorhamnose reductase
VDDLSGVYHMSCGGATTWYGFARAIVDRLDLPAKVTPIATSDYPLPARRPVYSVLDNEKLSRVFGIRLPQWEAALEECLASLPAPAAT